MSQSDTVIGATTGLLLIGTLRELEGNSPRFEPVIDLSLAQSRGEKTSDDDDVTRVLATRANAILQRDYGLGAATVELGLKWLSYIRVVLVMILLVADVGICIHILGRETPAEVSIEGFAVFLGMNLLFAIPPVLVMIAACFPGRGKYNPSRNKGTFAQALADGTKVFYLLFGLFRIIYGQVQRRLLNRAFPNSPSSERAQHFSQALEKLASTHFSLLTRILALTSHFCWAMTCTIVLICFVGLTTFRVYDFRWPSTWLDESRKLAVLEFVTSPIQWLPLTPVPDQQLVEYLSGNASTKSDAIKGTCAHLIAAFLLYYGLVPRLILLGVAWLQKLAEIRRLQPNVASPYFFTVLGYIRGSAMGPSDDLAPPTIAAIPAKIENVAAQRAVPESAPNVSTHFPLNRSDPDAPQALEEPTSPQSSRTLSVVFGYEVKAPTKGWEDVIPVSTFGMVVELSNANDHSSRQFILDELRSRAKEIHTMTIVVDLIGSPDSQCVNFLRSAMAPLADVTPFKAIVVLGGGERLRAKFSNDAERIRTRVLLWRQELLKCGLSENGILEFDHQTATAQSRQELLQRFQAICGNSPDQVTSRSANVLLAGRFKKASKLIRDAAEMVVGMSDAARLASETRNLHQQIQDLYQQEATLFAQMCAAMDVTSQPLATVLTAVGDPASAGIHKLQDGSKMLLQAGREKVEQAQQWCACFKGYLGGLDGRWAVAGGLAAALSGSLVGAPAMASVWLLVAGATLGAQFPSLIQKLQVFLPGGGDMGEKNAVAKVTTDDLCLDDLVRTNVIWALVLELQGNSESLIANTLEHLLTDCHPNLIDSVVGTQALLHDLEVGLRRLSNRASA